MSFSMQKIDVATLIFIKTTTSMIKPFNYAEKLIYFAVVSACDVAAGCGDGFV